MISILFLLAGFKQKALPVKKLASSPSTYTIGKKLWLAISFFVNQTNRPLLFVLLLNIFFAQIAFLAVIFIFFQRLADSSVLQGWSSLAIITVVSYILQTISVSVIGLYVSQINSEVRNRPRYIIKSDKDGSK